MLDLIKKYASIAAVSGEEYNLAKVITQDISPFADEIKKDALGNLIVFKKGKKRAVKKIMLDAHMDEIGFIITSVTSDGYLCFDKCGGIVNNVIYGRRVIINGVVGVIGSTAVHQLSGDDKSKIITHDNLVIDIGATSKEDALKVVGIGDCAVLESEVEVLGDNICSKALDDRIGCAILVKLIMSEHEYDTYYTFSVQEEVGCRGAITACYGVNPEFAIVVESTTAADLYGVNDEKTVSKLGFGPALSYMDNGTLYDKELVRFALKYADEHDIKAQAKTAVAGGNNSSAIHKTRQGVRTLAISAPCRYIHSSYCVASLKDVKNLFELCLKLKDELAGGQV